MTKWKCPTCGWKYESPIRVTGIVWHRGPMGRLHRLKAEKVEE